MLDDLTDRLMELKSKKFTGNVTLHYQNGVPKKLRLEEVQDLEPQEAEKPKPKRRMVR